MHHTSVPAFPDPDPFHSLPQNVHSSSSVPYSSSSQQFRQQYSALTPPSVSPGSYHPSPASSRDYSPYNGSPVSNGHGGQNGHSQSAAIPRHDLPSIQTSQSRLTSDLAVDTAHNIGQWHTAPMMSSAVDPIEPFVRLYFFSISIVLPAHLMR